MTYFSIKLDIAWSMCANACFGWGVIRHCVLCVCVGEHPFFGYHNTFYRYAGVSICVQNKVIAVPTNVAAKNVAYNLETLRRMGRVGFEVKV